MSQNPEDMHQTLVEHLTELRICLVRSLMAVAVGGLICWFYVEKIFDVIRAPIKPYLRGTQGGLVFTGVMDDFTAHIKVAVLGGVILSCPFWLYQVWRFVAPGLYSAERKYTAIFIFTGSFLFLCGVSFAYFFVYPAAFEFLLNFGNNADVPMITISEYLSFFFTTTLMFGLAFELPLIMAILGMLGLIQRQFLIDKRRYAVVVLAVVAAVITPPDIISMMMMLVPLMALYEVGIIAVSFFEKKRAAAST